MIIESMVGRLFFATYHGIIISYKQKDVIVWQKSRLNWSSGRNYPRYSG